MKRVKNLVITGAIALLSAVASHASQVTWGAAESNGVGDSSGTPLAVGNLVLLGHFNLTDSQIMQNGANTSFLLANFVQYASAFIGEGDPNPGPASDAGYWLANSVNSSNTLQIQNTQIYYWVFNSSTIGGASQQGIFTNPTSTAWKFPDDTAVPSTTVTDLSNVQHTVQGILWGSFGTGTSLDGISPLYNLAPIPEPSTVGLMTFGAGCLLVAVRRMRRS